MAMLKYGGCLRTFPNPDWVTGIQVSGPFTIAFSEMKLSVTLFKLARAVN